MLLNGEIALFTGGAGGIGTGVCEAFAEHGEAVIVGYNSSRDQAGDLAGRLPNPGGVGHAAYAAPVTDSAALLGLTREIEEAR